MLQLLPLRLQAGALFPQQFHRFVRILLPFAPAWASLQEDVFLVLPYGDIQKEWPLFAIIAAEAGI